MDRGDYMVKKKERKGKLTKTKLREFIRDEKQDAKKYEDLGLDALAKDERKHMRLLKQRLQRMEKKNASKKRKR